MEKSVFKFVFPKISKEYEAKVNPMHMEAAAVTAMCSENTDLCTISSSDGVLLVCFHNPKDLDRPFRFFYEDKHEEHNVILLIARDDTICDFEGDTIEDFMQEHESEDYHLVYETFDTSDEAHAFMKGIETFCDGQHQAYTFITEEHYDILSNRED